MPAVLVLTGCMGSIKYSEPCRAPVDLPERAISQGETFRYWARDRQALAECGAANGVLD
jgi:hypothetical protein